MRVLGIIASHRRQGNTEVLVKETLMGVEAEGGSVDVLRLTDYRIEPCRGDGRCESGVRPCHIQDDFNHLLDTIFQSDGIILGTPCYFLAVPGIFKLFLDRTVSVGHPAPLYQKPAAIIIPYGNRGYTAYALYQPNVLLHRWGMNIVDQALLQSGGPGDAMLQDRALARAREMGRRVARAIQTGDMGYRGEPGVCPVCHDRVIRILKNMETVECPTCGIRGKLTLVGNKIQVSFSPEDIGRGRYSSEHWYRHHIYHVEAGRDCFLRTKEARKERRGKYSAYLAVEQKRGEINPPP